MPGSTGGLQSEEVTIAALLKPLNYTSSGQFVCLCAYVCVYVYICMYVYMCMYVSVCIYVCICVGMCCVNSCSTKCYLPISSAWEMAPWPF